LLFDKGDAILSERINSKNYERSTFMITNDNLLKQFMQAGIDKLEIEDLLSDSFIIIYDLYNQ